MLPSNVLDLMCSTSWAMIPQVFDSMREVVMRHANGEKLTTDKVQAAIGRDPTTEHPDNASPQVIGSDLVVPMRGVLSRFADQVNGISQARGRSAESLQADLQAAAADSSISRIVLNIHSPAPAESSHRKLKS